MYVARLLSTRFSRELEWTYNAINPFILTTLKQLRKLTGGRSDKPFTWLEKQFKGFFFDCKMCGNCILSSTGMTCPMNCPKTMRNGPCGGVRANGHCEVKPEMKCVWTQAWQGAAQMRANTNIENVQILVNYQHQGSSAWLRLIDEEAPSVK